MNLKKYVPLAFSRKTVMVAIGDLMYSANTEKFFTVTGEGDQVNNLSSALPDKGVGHLYVVKYAERGYTAGGSQPVGDAVRIDVKIKGNGSINSTAAGVCSWGVFSTIISWKPNMNVMLSRSLEFNPEVAVVPKAVRKILDSAIEKVALQSAASRRESVHTAENNTYKVMYGGVPEDEAIGCEDAAVKTLKQLGYAYRGGEFWAPPIGKIPANIQKDIAASKAAAYLKSLQTGNSFRGMMKRIAPGFTGYSRSVQKTAIELQIEALGLPASIDFAVNPDVEHHIELQVEALGLPESTDFVVKTPIEEHMELKVAVFGTIPVMYRAFNAAVSTDAKKYIASKTKHSADYDKPLNNYSSKLLVAMVEAMGGSYTADYKVENYQEHFERFAKALMESKDFEIKLK